MNVINNHNSLNKEKYLLIICKNRIGIHTIILGSFIFLTLINDSPIGAGLGKVIIPVVCYFAYCFLFKTKSKIKFNTNHILTFLFWFFAVISTAISEIVVIERDVYSSLIFTCFFVLSTAYIYIV